MLGLARNERLVKRIEKALHKSHSRYTTTGAASRRFRWLPDPHLLEPRTPRVAKAEHLAKGPNPRFVVTSLGPDGRAATTPPVLRPRRHGKSHQRVSTDLFADRTSTATLRANQLRLYFASFATFSCTACGAWAWPARAGPGRNAEPFG